MKYCSICRKRIWDNWLFRQPHYIFIHRSQQEEEGEWKEYEHVINCSRDENSLTNY